MALIKGFDPSKQFKVVKTFFEGGRKYKEGDLYDPQSKIGKSKRLFRHYVAKRIVPIVEDEPVSKSYEFKKEESQTAGDTEQEYQAPKKRGRKKKTSKEDDLS